MKHAALILCWVVLLSSCKEVSFREPQPRGVTPLTEIPRGLHGNYVGLDEHGDNTDTLVVESWGYHFMDTKDKDWLGRGVISDSLVIKYYQNYYFVNFRSGDQWVLRLVKQKPNGAIEFMAIPVNDDAKRKEILRKLSRKIGVKEIERNGDTFYQIDPTKEQLIDLIKDGFFTGNELHKVK
ncbi:MAG: hypothetical protein SH819_01125 [Cytophagales bacterium]|nr:hypothetical protein [Cytophagales bacterium]